MRPQAALVHFRVSGYQTSPVSKTLNPRAQPSPGNPIPGPLASFTRKPVQNSPFPEKFSEGNCGGHLLDTQLRQ
jgi:hypothetical protein